MLLRENNIRKLKIHEQNYLIGTTVLLLLVVLTGGYFWKSRQKLQNQIEQQKIISDAEENERSRIARDIHDDLGSGLSKINFLSELVLRASAGSPALLQNAKLIQETDKSLTDNMRDLIWALHPDQVTFAGLMAKLREYTTEYLENYGVAVRYEFPDASPDLKMTNESHHAIFMVVKEALHNIVKHAQASNVQFRLQLSHDALKLDITDDGRAFDLSGNRSGNGLKNMAGRIKALHGQFIFTAARDRETQLVIELPLSSIRKN